MPSDRVMPGYRSGFGGRGGLDVVFKRRQEDEEEKQKHPPHCSRTSGLEKSEVNADVALWACHASVYTLVWSSTTSVSVDQTSSGFVLFQKLYDFILLKFCCQIQRRLSPKLLPVDISVDVQK